MDELMLNVMYLAQHQLHHIYEQSIILVSE